MWSKKPSIADVVSQFTLVIRGEPTRGSLRGIIGLLRRIRLTAHQVSQRPVVPSGPAKMWTAGYTTKLCVGSRELTPTRFACGSNALLTLVATIVTFQSTTNRTLFGNRPLGKPQPCVKLRSGNHVRHSRDPTYDIRFCAAGLIKVSFQ